jgi:hypothetical protein
MRQLCGFPVKHQEAHRLLVHARCCHRLRFARKWCPTAYNMYDRIRCAILECTSAQLAMNEEHLTWPLHMHMELTRYTIGRET